jgi:hypothetical protein
MFPQFAQEWKTRSFISQSLFTLLYIGCILTILPRFLDAIEHRQGVILADPVLRLLPPVDLTWLTFLLIYVSILTCVLILVRSPQHLLLALQAYGTMVVFRMLAMAITPLDPPPDMLALKDPFVEFFGTGRTLTRDLFFSGHTATIFVLSLVSPYRFAKRMYALSTALVAICVLLQHVHYTVDVLAAPFFAFGSVQLVHWFRAKVGIPVPPSSSF